MKSFIYALLLVGLVISFVSADMIGPGQKNIPIENVITNIQNFPDYTFVCVCAFKAQDNSIEDIYSYEVINNDGKIIPYYNRPCNENSVYAFKRVDLPLIPFTEESLLEYINLRKGIKVIEGIETSEYSTITDSRSSIIKEYTISMDSMTTNPSSITTNRNFLMYLYYLIPLLAIGIVIYIIMKRNNKKKND